MKNGGKPILMTHVGRPKDKKTGLININDETAVTAIVNYLSDKLNKDIEIVDFPNEAVNSVSDLDTINKSLESLDRGESDIIYLPNTRWFYGEEDKGDCKCE